MKCPGCGAGLTAAMVDAGECGYCHTAVAKPTPAASPKVVHVIHSPLDRSGLRVEIRGPDVHVGGLFDSITARLAGCFTGCLSAGVSIGITGLILLFVGWQLWVQSRAMNPTPSPSPSPAPPSAEHPRKGRR